MNWYYAENNERRGPVTEDAFEQLVRDGTITPDTLVWQHGMDQWQPYRDIAGPQPKEIPPPLTGAASDVPTTGVFVPVAAPERDGPPWEHRGSLGLMEAILGTVKGVLMAPSVLFAGMKRNGGLTDPLQYALLVGSIGTFIGCIYNVIYQRIDGYAGVTPDMHIEHMHLTGSGAAYELISAVFLVPLIVILTTFVNAGIVHLCLMLLGAAKQPFETTYRVVCYSLGSSAVLQIIPGCGSLACAIWNLISTCIGIAKAHEISTGKAVAVVLLPTLLCCGVVISVMVAVIGFLTATGSHH